MDNNRRREALRVRFTANVEADASEVGGGGEGEGGEGGGGGGVEAGGKEYAFQKKGELRIKYIEHLVRLFLGKWG